MIPVILLVTTLAASALAVVAPTGVPLPTGAQLQWMASEMGAIGHFNMVCIDPH